MKGLFYFQNIRGNSNEEISMEFAGDAAIGRLYMQIFLIV